jgi:hypothetical protein
MKTHDEHYRRLDIEPIEVMEQRVRESDVPPIPALNVAIALKYILRAGLKEGQPWEVDIEKAKNHLHRALNGEWLTDQKKLKEVREIVKDKIPYG